MFKVIRKKDQDMFETHVDSLVKADHPYSGCNRVALDFVLAKLREEIN